MSKPVQSIENIAPVAEQKTSEDTVLNEYEEGKKFLENGDTAQAAVALHNALLGYEERDDKTGVANASNQLGKVCLEREEYSKAQHHFERAWEVCNEMGDPSSLLALLQQYVIVYRGLEEYKKAIETCLDILSRYQDNNDPRGTVTTLESMAEIYIEMGEKEKAVDTYRTIAKIHANFKHESMAQGFLQKAEELEGES